MLGLSPVAAPPERPIPAAAPSVPKTGPHPLVHANEDVAAVARALGGAAPPTPDTVQTRAVEPAAIADAVAPAATAPRPVPAAPARTSTCRLVVVVEDGSDGKVFPIEGPETFVGRTEGDVVLFDDPYVSPRHARIYESGGGYRIADLRSLNGVYLRTRGRRPLESGDLILLGSQVLQFQLVSEEERHLGPVSQQGTRVFGSKPVTRVARLDQRSTNGLLADVYYVTRDETILGREVGDVVFTSDAFLSRRHAALRRDPSSGAFTLEDLDSSNGTFVAIRNEVELHDGDRLRIGQHLFRFERRALSAGRANGGTS